MKFLKISMFGAVLSLCGLGFSDTAQGQTLTASPSSMTFTVQSGGATGSQPLSISSTIQAPTLLVSLINSPTWLTVNNVGSGNTFTVNAPANSPEVFTVAVNTSGLSTTQTTYAGSFTIQVNGIPNSTLTYFVTLTLGGPSLLSSSPQSLSFSATAGAVVGNPSFIPVTISSSSEQLIYTISAATQTGGTWILLSTTGPVATNSGSTGFTVQVNPSGLAVGTYNGTITLQSQSTSDSLTIPVTLSVTQGQTLDVTGTLTNFFYQYQSGQAGYTAQTQTLMISTNSGTVPYTITPTSNQTTNWLVINPQASTVGTTPQAVTFSLSYQYLTQLSPGTYTINLAIAAGGQTVNETATLVISSNPLLTVSPSSLTFSIPLGTQNPTPQTVTVGSSNNSTNIPFLVQSNTSWLSVSASSGSTVTNPSFQVFVNTASLGVNTTPYMGSITVTPNNGDAGVYTITIPVSVTITAATTQLQAGPQTLLFSYEINHTTSLPQQLIYLSSPTAIGFTATTSTVAASNCPTSNWLSVSATQTVTPATLYVGVTPTGMTAGYCSGTVTVTYNNGTSSNATLTIPVTVDVSSTALLTVSTLPGFGVITATYQTTGSLTSSISINSTDGSALGFTASATTSVAGWLFLGASSGTTQQNLQVQILPSSLSVGVYTGSITINAVNAANLPSGAITIPVTLTVVANSTVNVSPVSLSFTQAQGSNPPASQNITLTPSGSTTFTATVSPITGGNWLTVSPSSGNLSTSPVAITASVAQNTLSPGVYSSNISLYFPTTATSATVNVKLTITAAQAVTVAPTALNFSYQLGGTAPATQTLNVTSTGGAVSVSVGTTTTGTNAGWLAVSATSGTTGASGSPLALTVTVSPTGFTAAGTYTGTITITPTGLTPITVAVTLTVTGVPIPQLFTLANSASGAYGAIAPGELITIKGSGVGPSTAVSFSVAPGNTVVSTLGGVQVFFDGIPGTPTYVSSTQVNVIVPYEIAGRTTTNVTLEYQGGTSAAIPESVANQAPGIYTFSATGAGQAAVLNQNGTFNGPAAGLVINGQNVSTTPATQGSTIAVYMTGGGQTSPASATGTVTPTNTLYRIPGNVTATVNGVPATVAFAGAAPGLVTGVIQVNLTLPTGVTGNNLSLVITINGSPSLSGPTIAIQ